MDDDFDVLMSDVRDARRQLLEEMQRLVDMLTEAEADQARLRLIEARMAEILSRTTVKRLVN